MLSRCCVTTPPSSCHTPRRDCSLCGYPASITAQTTISTTWAKRTPPEEAESVGSWFSLRIRGGVSARFVVAFDDRGRCGQVSEHSRAGIALGAHQIRALEHSDSATVVTTAGQQEHPRLWRYLSVGCPNRSLAGSAPSFIADTRFQALGCPPTHGGDVGGVGESARLDL